MSRQTKKVQEVLGEGRRESMFRYRQGFAREGFTDVVLLCVHSFMSGV